MTVRYAVTFEFETRAPLTHRGTIAGSSTATCVSRAVRIAQKALRPVAWSSLNVVVLERLVEQSAGASDDGRRIVVEPHATDAAARSV